MLKTSVHGFFKLNNNSFLDDNIDEKMGCFITLCNQLHSSSHYVHSQCIIHQPLLSWLNKGKHVSDKVIYPKYSKHWPYILTSAMDCGCSKILDYGLFLSLFNFFLVEIHSKSN